MNARKLLLGFAVAAAFFAVSVPLGLNAAGQRRHGESREMGGKPAPVMLSEEPSDEGFGNNLSTPVIFSEGIGLSGLPLSLDSGLRPRPGEPAELAELPYLLTLDPDSLLFLQQTENCWQAEFEDGTERSVPVEVTVDWSDNLVRQTWTPKSVIRVEVVLQELLDENGEPTREELMQGYPMFYAFGEGRTEMYGVAGPETVPTNATAFSVCPRLVIAKLLESGEEVVLYEGTIAEGLGSDGPGYYNAEINVAGKVIYGYNWFLNQMDTQGLPKEGWWRIYFIIDESATIGEVEIPANTMLCNLHPGDLDPEVLHMPQLVPGANVTFLDLEIVDNRKGGKRPTDVGGGGEGEH